MDDPKTAARPAAPVVTLAAEIDSTNCDQAAAVLALALYPGVSVVVADMTRTTFCDSSAVRALVQAHNRAASQGIELRLVVNSDAVLRVLELTGLTSTLRLYPDIDAAIGDEQGP